MPVRATVRRFRPADLEPILAIERASFGRYAYDRKLFAEYYAGCGPLFLVAARAGRICGYLIACTRGDSAELVSIAVAPAARRSGAASTLFRSLLRRLRRRNVTRLALMVRTDNAGAHAFYARYGFRNVRRVRGYYEDGADAWLMRRDV